MPEMKVVVEYRDKDGCTLVFLGSSREKAMEFIAKSKDYSDGRDGPWWWSVYSMAVDVDPIDTEGSWDDLAFFAPDGTRLEHQPVRCGP